MKFREYVLEAIEKDESLLKEIYLDGYLSALKMTDQGDFSIPIKFDGKKYSIAPNQKINKLDLGQALYQFFSKSRDEKLTVDDFKKKFFHFLKMDYPNLLAVEHAGKADKELDPISSMDYIMAINPT